MQKHLEDFRIEYCESLVGKLLRSKFTLDYYFSSKTKPLESKYNLNIEKVAELIKCLNDKLEIRRVDTESMTAVELRAVYDSCVKWVQDPRNRKLPSGERRFVHDVFTGASPGDRIGKETPALIGKDTASGELLFVSPHEFQTSHFSLLTRQNFVSLDVIIIYDLLAHLKRDLEKRLSTFCFSLNLQEDVGDHAHLALVGFGANRRV